MDMEEERPNINVKKLISAFENRTTSPEVTYSRPRARSLGNILAKNVTVRESQFETLDEISDVLEVIQHELQLYETYNKGSHVAFQEELFNILTSIINIDNDDPKRARSLISTTKHLVSVLNNKLPSNNPAENRYIKYSEQVNGTQISNRIIRSKEHSTVTVKNGKDTVIHESGVRISNNTVESTKETKTVGLSRSVSVKKLTELFQGDTKTSQSGYQRKYTSKVEHTVKVSNKQIKHSNSMKEISKNTATEVKKNYVVPSLEPTPIDTKFSVSVSNLRNLFEVKSKEASEGLPIILKEDKPPITRFNYKFNPNEEPELVSYTPDKLAKEGSSRLLELLKRDAEATNQSFKYSFNVSEHDDAGEVTPVESPNGAENDVMANLEFVEENDDGESESISGDSLNSGDSLKTVESLKSSNNNNSLEVNNHFIDEHNDDDDEDDDDEYNHYSLKIEEIDGDENEHLSGNYISINNSGSYENLGTQSDA